MTDLVAKAICAECDYGNFDLIWSCTEHSGDCTNEPFTCGLCLKIELQEAAQAVRKAVVHEMRDLALIYSDHSWSALKEYAEKHGIDLKEIEND